MKKLLPFLYLFLFTITSPRIWAADRPNILWITSEDNGQQLGCYGDAYANTPNIDHLAKQGMRFTHAWSNAPVCAPARTTIISGRFPTSDGSEHMRSGVPMPEGHRMYPQLLREAGYYCTNNSKEDYNLIKPEGVWDESSNKAHYLNRKPGQPFFAVFNILTSHESQIRKPGHVLVHDPARAPIPPYHPDTPEVRHDWAQYYDKITEMDQEVGQRLTELEKAGLADDTIIFYYGDHGAGMPRSKRWPYNTGLRVPMIVYFPKKFAHLAPKDYQPSGASRRLVSFVDLAPTLLSIIGKEAPGYFQGKAFAGEHVRPAAEFMHGFRGRMDERYDLVRSVSDGRYVYLREYMPHLPYGQYIGYMFQMPTTQVWKQQFDDHKLNETQQRFWQSKPSEELYDLETDPWEIHNLAESKEHSEVLARLRKAQQEQSKSTRDLGFIPEAERLGISSTKSPHDAFSQDDAYPILDVLAMASLASDSGQKDLTPFISALSAPNSIVRYWGVMGLIMRQTNGGQAGSTLLMKRLEDESPSVRIAAAEALGAYGTAQDLVKSLDVLLAAATSKGNTAIIIEALNVVDRLGEKAAPIKSQIQEIPAASKKEKGTDNRLAEYPERLKERLKSSQ
ncbi:MAG: hypothetical protein RL693_318 [Verrucomicrobiota bacterium]|jgi:uncharacterized sulfatase